MYEVVLLPKAEKAFVRADAPLARKLARAFRSLEADPLRRPNIKALSGPLKGFFRLRTGDHRIVYRVDAEKKKQGLAADDRRADGRRGGERDLAGCDATS